MPISILALGLLLGIRHATDADHVIAISTISTKEKGIKESALIGILWAIGHSITVTLVGVPIIFFSLKIPLKIGMVLEFSVGAMLVVLGLINLYSYRSQLFKTLTSIIHNHSHSHLNTQHAHVHIHLKNNPNDQIHHLSLSRIVRPISIGLIHGLAGSSTIAILILSTIRSSLLAAIYLIIFHVGVILGMMIITTLLGISINAANKKIAFLHKYLVLGSGLLSIIFGVYIMRQIGA